MLRSSLIVATLMLLCGATARANPGTWKIRGREYYENGKQGTKELDVRDIESFRVVPTNHLTLSGTPILQAVIVAKSGRSTS